MEVAVVAVRVKSDWVGAACTASVVGSQAESEPVPMGATLVGAPDVSTGVVCAAVGDTRTSGGTVDAVPFASAGAVVGGKTPILDGAVDSGVVGGMTAVVFPTEPVMTAGIPVAVGVAGLEVTMAGSVEVGATTDACPCSGVVVGAVAEAI